MPVHAGAFPCCIHTAPTDRADARGAPKCGLRVRGAAAEPPCALPLRTRMQALAACAHCKLDIQTLQLASHCRVAAIARALCDCSRPAQLQAVHTHHVQGTFHQSRRMCTGWQHVA